MKKYFRFFLLAVAVSLSCKGAILKSEAVSAKVELLNDSIELVDQNVVEEVSFIDIDGAVVKMTRFSTPDGVASLTISRNDVSKTREMNVDFVSLVSESRKSNRLIATRESGTVDVFLGTASTVTYFGPEYYVASDLASAIADSIPNITLSNAFKIASYIFDLYAKPTPLWVKKVTFSYEVHGAGGGGFLGYYHMKDAFYSYTSKDTTGPDYIQVTYEDRYGTTPGL